MEKVIGKVTEEEKNEIRQLFERRNGLNELAKILTSEDDALYEKMVRDLGETSVKFQEWWDSKAIKYNWEKVENGSWSIDFSTNKIYLVLND